MLLIAVFIHFGFILVQYPVVSTNGEVQQNLAHACLNLSDCPAYGTQEWRSHQTECCKYMHEKAFHCQRQNDQIITACLDQEMSKPGEFLFLHRSKSPDGSFTARLDHCNCSQDTFEPYERKSMAFQDPTCSFSKQTCRPDNGKLLTSSGDSSHDNRCRCLWENGWAPDISRVECMDPSGFTSQAHMMCTCQKKYCDPGRTLNDKYDCISASAPVNIQLTEAQPQSTAASSTTAHASKSQTPRGTVLLIAVAATHALWRILTASL